MSIQVGMCHGCFDLLHIGHILHFKEASQICDSLVVSITADNYVNKEAGRPLFKIDERFEILSSIKYIDKVIVSNSPTADLNLLTIKPNIYIKGTDYSNLNDERLEKERLICDKIGCKIVFTNSPKYSSTHIIKMCQSIIL